MASTHDDSFREIQLSGKQLVFLFMAVVVILVGTFLMGLLVGRGVLAARGARRAPWTADEAEAEPPAAAIVREPGIVDLAGDRGEKLSYAERLGSAEPAKEQLKAEATPAPARGCRRRRSRRLRLRRRRRRRARPTPRRHRRAATAPAEPAGDRASRSRSPRFVSVKKRTRSSSGSPARVIPAYVVTPAKGAPPVFRVRVGKFKERREADTVAARLQKEEQFKPWIVR